jgi:hypothetical protein
MTERAISEIANEIQQDWKNVNYGAKPYLEAMKELNSVDDNFYEDSAESVIAYFLGNARSWKGETAKRIKLELNNLIK